MIINSNTRISKLIEHNEDTISVISSINRHFKKLKNPFLRKALAPRVSIADAAKIGGVPVCVMIDKLKQIGFTTEDDCGCETASPENKYGLKNENTDMKKETIIELDVRPVLEGGVDPFEIIMVELKKMNDGETLKIINTFEPIPLLNILKTKGYVYETERPEAGLVYTFLEKSGAEINEETMEQLASEFTYEEVEQKFAGRMKEVDVRQLEMPMPMVTILEEIEGIQEGSALYVHHRKLPQFLIPELEQRNYKWVSKEIDDSNLKLIIFK